MRAGDTKVARPPTCQDMGRWTSIADVAIPLMSVEVLLEGSLREPPFRKRMGKALRDPLGLLRVFSFMEPRGLSFPETKHRGLTRSEYSLREPRGVRRDWCSFKEPRGEGCQLEHSLSEPRFFLRSMASLRELRGLRRSDAVRRGEWIGATAETWGDMSQEVKRHNAWLRSLSSRPKAVAGRDNLGMGGLATSSSGPPAPLPPGFIELSSSILLVTPKFCVRNLKKPGMARFSNS